MHDEMHESMTNAMQPQIDIQRSQIQDLYQWCRTLDQCQAYQWCCTLDHVSSLGHRIDSKFHDVNRTTAYILDCNVRLRHMQLDYERLSTRVQELEQNQNKQSDKMTQLEARMQEISKTMQEQHQRHCSLVSIDFDNDRKRLQQLELSVGVMLNLIQCGGDKSKILPPLMLPKDTPQIKNI